MSVDADQVDRRPVAPADVDRFSAGAVGEGAGAGAGVLRLLNGGFLLVWGLITAFPLIWVMISSVKSTDEFLTDPRGLPTSFHFDNFSRAWSEANMGRFLLNSVIVISMSVPLTMLLGAMAAYVLGRYAFIGSRVVYYAFVVGLVFPIFLALVPLFFVVRNLEGLPLVGSVLGINSYFSLAIVYAAFSMPFTVFFLTAFFRTQPKELEEAAMMDGCSHFGVFFRVMLPLAKPGLISIGLFNVLGHWNQYILPVVLMNDDNKKVLSQGLADLAIAQGTYDADWSGLLAGLTLALLPVLIVYLIFQRQLHAGLTTGILK